MVTRSLGASVADWLAVSRVRGGLALGTGPVSLVLVAAIAAFVYHLSRTGKDIPPDQGPRTRPGSVRDKAEAAIDLVATR